MNKIYDVKDNFFTNHPYIVTGVSILVIAVLGYFLFSHFSSEEASQGFAKSKTLAQVENHVDTFYG